MKKIIVTSLALLSVVTAGAKVKLPQLFQTGMVIQRHKPVSVWGHADAGEQVKVVFKNKVYHTQAAADGRFSLALPPQKAGGPYRLQVNDVTIDSCMVGDVWLCSGQSNIDVTVERVYPQYGRLIDDYRNDRIRLFRVQTEADTHGVRDDVRPTPTNWRPATKDDAWHFSAVGYFLAREMYEKTGVAQGVIVNSLGGSPIQAWLSSDTLRRQWPDEWRRTVYYQDDATVDALQRANAAANARWQQMMDDSDPLLRDVSNMPEEGWHTVGQYDNLTGQRQYVGSLWARQTLQVDARHAGQPARLLVGTLYDADYTYLNGQLVGHTAYQYPPRRYDVASGVLHEGENTLAVRFITKGGNPHFIEEKPYKLVFDDGTEVPLSTTWQVREGARMPACPQTDVLVQNLPSVLYNAMLYPLAPYALQGVVWYQGESNTGADAVNYRQWLTQLVGGWRQLWHDPGLPFVVVQLANFMQPSAEPQESGWSVVREAQRQVAAEMTNVELAVAIDLGERVDIHPLRKREVAQRIALGFERMLVDGKLPLSPEVTVCRQTGRREVTLTLDQPLRDETSLAEFETAGADRRYVNATATAHGRQIVITSAVDDPVYVRYAWKNNPACANVYGRNGLPMSPMQLTVDSRKE